MEPTRSWFCLMGISNDAVVVIGYATTTAGPDRDGDVGQAITAALLDVGRATNALWLRLAPAGVVLGGVGLLAATKRCTQGWEGRTRGRRWRARWRVGSDPGRVDGLADSCDDASHVREDLLVS